MAGKGERGCELEPGTATWRPHPVRHPVAGREPAAGRAPPARGAGRGPSRLLGLVALVLLSGCVAVRQAPWPESESSRFAGRTFQRSVYPTPDFPTPDFAAYTAGKAGFGVISGREGGHEPCGRRTRSLCSRREHDGHGWRRAPRGLAAGSVDLASESRRPASRVVPGARLSGRRDSRRRRHDPGPGWAAMPRAPASGSDQAVPEG